MEKANEDSKPDDGLEIASIGSIYTGPWDKKYWSSSRGKDRYPYPLGYQAVRTHNGSTYKMEIQQGLKGPLFVIDSSGGQSSGQTPDLAWSSLQKKSCSLVKMRQEKKSSRKIDGVELFGFRNPFIQRLLRELVANVNGTVPQNLLSSSFCNIPSGTKNDARWVEPCTYTDLLPHLERPPIRRKRSRQNKTTCIPPDNAARHKRLQPVDSLCNSNALNCSGGTNFTISSTLDEERVICNHHGAVSESLPLVTVIKDLTGSCLCRRDSQLESSVSFKSMRRGGLLPQDDNKRTTENCKSLSTTQEPLIRSPDTELMKFNSWAEKEQGEVPVPKACPVITCMDLFAPDTLHILHDDASAFAPTSSKEILYNVEGNSVVAEDLVTKLHTKEGISKSISNPCPEKSDFDSVGQDIAKSMMTVLLPQALPFLKGSKEEESLKGSLCHAKSEEHNYENEPFVDVRSIAGMATMNCHADRKEKLDNFSADLDLVVPKSEDIKSFNPDSFENDASGYYVENRIPQVSNIVKVNESTSDGDLCTANLELPGSRAIAQKSVFCHETSDNKEIFTHDVLVASNERLIRVDNHLSESPSACMSPSPRTKVFSRRSKKSKNLKAYSEDILAVAQLSSAFKVEKKIIEDQNREGSDGIIQIIPKLSLSADEKKIIEDQNCEESDGIIQIIPKLSLSADYLYNSKKVQEASDLFHNNVEVKNELEGIAELVGCYVHPMPVSSVLLKSKLNEICICVLCGNPLGMERTLFLYKVLLRERRPGNPSFVGHASIILPTSTDNFHREIAMERSCFEFTPDGEYLVFINKIKAPYCREMEIECSCSACASDFQEENAVKIVQVEHGYVSLVVKLITADSVHSILVCGPNHLVVVEESGKLNLWVMNATWSARAEEFVLPAYDFIVELKKIPKCNTLVVGHNGFGGFFLWDISKRTLVSRFYAPGTSVFDFLPLSLCSWQRKVPVSSSADVEEQVNTIIDSTRKWFSEQSENYARLPLEEDVAIWLLVSTVPDSDAQQKHQSSHCQTTLGQWRLALLVKDVVFLGSVLDPRATVVGASDDLGIIGTLGGLVYMWKVPTGTKIGTLHCFKGQDVSCIAVNDSWPHLIAVTGGGCLLLYLPLQRALVNT